MNRQNQYQLFLLFFLSFFSPFQSPPPSVQRHAPALLAPCKTLSNRTCLSARERSGDGNRWRNEYCCGHRAEVAVGRGPRSSGSRGWGSGSALVLMEGKKAERCISGPQIAAVYSSTNPKFCAALAVARKQLTVKRGGSEGLVSPVGAQTATLPLLPALPLCKHPARVSDFSPGFYLFPLLFSSARDPSLLNLPSV